MVLFFLSIMNSVDPLNDYAYRICSTYVWINSYYENSYACIDMDIIRIKEYDNVWLKMIENVYHFKEIYI